MTALECPALELPCLVIPGSVPMCVITKQDPQRVERCVLHLDVYSLDLNQVGDHLQ
jgi:hypothetical protein